MDWQDINSVNIKALDDDHQEMAAILSELSATPTLENIRSLLPRLLDYAGRHFAFEEKLFAEHGYPDKDVHTFQHRHFTERVQVYRQRLEDGELDVDEFLSFLSTWWIEHVNNADMKYSTFLNKRGVY